VTTKRNHLPNIRGLLTGQGLSIPDDEIYAGPLHEGMADDCISMVEQGGSPPDDSFGAGGEAIQYPSVQVRVRHTNYTDGKSDVDDCWALLHDMDLADYAPPRMRGSGPIYLRPDEDARHEWTINMILFIAE